jgi:2-polyprenyl-6-hydroxyphenyl methylase/3-demethylubiquinone-9 3-methyltransferase
MLPNDLEFYDRSAAVWWDGQAKVFALNRLNPLRFKFFDRYVSTWTELKVLDVGCGGGYTCEFLAQRGVLVTGIDQSQLCIEAARDHALHKGFSIDYHFGHVEHLPFEEGSFDVVVCVDVLEHVTDWVRAIAEIHRVLRPQGLFLFDTINRTFASRMVMIWLLEYVLREIPQGIHDWKLFIQPHELTDQLQKIGFTETIIQGFDLFGETALQKIRAYFRYRKTQDFQVKFNNNTEVMYIGKAVKVGPPVAANSKLR